MIPRWLGLLCLALPAAMIPGDPAVETQWQPVDVVLGCYLVTEDGPPGAFGGSAIREKARLVLKQVPVPAHDALEGLGDFEEDTGTEGDPSVTFEASVALARMPGAEAFVHAECNEQEVACEIAPSCPEAACFVVQARLAGAGPSVSLLMKALEGAENPGSPGKIRTAVEFQVTTETPSVTLLLGATGSLHCSFSMAPGLELAGVQWRLQHKGHGKLVSSWTATAEPGQATREEATLDPERLLTAGDATLSLPGLTLEDEGTYICQVTTTQYQLQQVIQLSVQAPPKVRLSVTQTAALPTVVCAVSGYYPLPVGVTWTREAPGGAPAPVPEDASFSSLRQSAAGTYSISSSLRVDAAPEGAVYTCEVTHSSLEEPLRVSTRVDPRTERQAGMDAVTLTITVFLVILLCWVLWRQQVFFPRSAKPLRYSV
ncbi:tapasin-related protein isoform 1-T3 [Thomomys bottae]